MCADRPAGRRSAHAAASDDGRARCAPVCGRTTRDGAHQRVCAAAGGAFVATDRRTSGTQLEDQGIEIKAANSLRDDTDLGARWVTVNVPALSPDQLQQALELGLDCARQMQAHGWIHAALLCCQGQVAVADALACWME